MIFVALPNLKSRVSADNHGSMKVSESKICQISQRWAIRKGCPHDDLSTPQISNRAVFKITDKFFLSLFYNNLEYKIKDMATLSTNQLLDKVKDFIEHAYQLGEEECKWLIFNILNVYVLI